MTVLTVSSGLFLVLIFHIGLFLDSLFVCDLRSVQLNLYFVFVQQSAYHDIQMLVAHTIEQGLTVFCIIYYFDGQILMGHLLQCLGDLIHVRLILRLIPHIGIRSGNIELAIFDGRGLGRETVAGSRCGQFRQCSDISGMQLADFDRLIALQYIDFADLFLNVTVYVVQQVVGLKYTGVYLNQRVFSDERIHYGLPDIGGFCLGEIVIRMVNLIGL